MPFLIIALIIVIQIMIACWLEQFQTLQQYIHSLFDCDCISIDRLAANQPVVEETVRLLTSYGKKIMQLSEQATYQHRNQHYLARRQVEQQLSAAHRAILGEDAHQTTYQQMIKAINQKLQEDRKSIWNRFSMPESRVVPAEGRRESRAENSGLKQSGLKEEEKNVRASKGKSRVSKNGAVKQALQIKGYMQHEEDAIRDFFSKLNKMLETHKVPVGNMQQEALKFTRVTEQNSDRITDLIRTSSEAHTRNINNLCSLVELLHEALQQRLKNEGQAEGRLSTFLEEAQRMEETYSFTLSKMLERLAQAKEALPSDAVAGKHLQSLQEITRKLFRLYPSQQNMQSLAVRAREGKNIGVQVSLSKTQQAKVGGDSFRLQARVAECLDRFERNNKHRKTFELKELQKLIENVREILPVKQAKSQTDNSYHEEIKGLLDLQQKREKEAVDALTKKLKKAQKRAQQLEAAFEDMKQQAIAARQEWQQQRKKLNRRSDNEQSELKKMAKEKAALDANLSEYIKEVEKMRQQVRKQGEEESRLRKILQRQCNQLREQCETLRLRFKTASEQGKTERQQIIEERSLYRQKIELTETQLQEERQLSVGLRVQLQAALGQNREARSQLQEMSRIYEQKIRQLDGVIEHLRELQQVKIAQETAIEELQSTNRKQQHILHNTQRSLREEQERVRKLQGEKKKLEEEVEHWKAEGGLTESDLKLLREQVEKVSKAYLQSEEQLEVMRRQMGATIDEREKLLRERLRLSRLVEDLQGQIAALKVKHQATQLSERDLRDEYYQTAQENKRLQRQADDLRREAAKNRKQVQEQREERAKTQRQLRQLRQQQQGKREAENVEQGRRRMQLQNLRIELRRKSEQAEKQQASYQQKLSMAYQKIKELEQLYGQKHLLSRLMNNHQTQ